MKISEAKVLSELYKTYNKNMLMEEDKKLIRDVIKIIEKQSWPKHINDYTPIERIERLEEKIDRLTSSVTSLHYK
ncbi:hypothetical protein N9Z41_00550 [bacterium]|nr:hypothetical protein [bacterium]